MQKKLPGRAYLIILFFASAFACAQDVVWDPPTVAAGPLSICADEKKVIIPFTAPTLSSGVLEINLPAGVSVVAGSELTGRSDAGLPAVYYDGTTSTAQMARFIIGTSTVSGGENITVTFGHKAGCGAVSGSVTYTISLVDNTTFISPRNNASFNIGKASLSIPSVANSPVTAGVGQTVLRTVNITNSATDGGFTKEFYYKEVYPAGQYLVSANSFTLTNTNSLTDYIIPAAYIYFSPTNDTIIVKFDTTLIKKMGVNLDNKFDDNNENFQLKYHLIPAACGLITSTGYVYWGCGESVCDIKNYVINQNVVQGDAPDLQFSRSEPSKICLDAANQYTITITNAGAGYADSVTLNIYSPYSNQLLYHDTASVLYIPGSTGIPVHPVISGKLFHSNATLFNAATNCDYNGKTKAFTINVPAAIAPGETVRIIFDTYYCAFNNYAYTAPASMSQYLKYALYDGVYYDFCGNKLSSIGNVLTNYTDWQCKSVLNNPINISATQTKNFVTLITYENYANVNTVYNKPDAYYQVTMVLPPGIEFDDNGGDGAAWYTSGGVPWPNSTILLNTGLTNATNTVVVSFPASTPINTFNSNLVFKLKGLDYTLSGGSCGNKFIQQYIQFVPDPTGSICPPGGLPLNLVYNSYNVYLYCGVPCTEGTVMDDFNLRRTSYGYPDNDEDGLPDATGTIDLSKIHDERVMQGDTITATYKARIVTTGVTITSFSQVYAELKMPPEASYYALVSSSANVTSTHGIFSGTISAVFSGTLVTCDLSALGVPDFRNNDEIQVDVVFREITNIGGAVASHVFVADMYASNIPNPTGVDRKTCSLPFGKTINVVGYYHTNAAGSGGNNSGTSLTFTDCQDKKFSVNYYLSVGPCCGNYNGGNLFPYEVRRWSFLDSVKVTVPAGYSIVASSVVTNYRTAGIGGTAVEPTIGTLTPIRANGNVHVFYYGDTYVQNGGAYLNISDDGWIMNHIYTIRPSAAVVQNVYSSLNVVSYFKSTGQLSPATDPKTTNFSLYYSGPQQLLTDPVVSSVNAVTDSVIWTANILNKEPAIPAKNTWLYFKSGSGLIAIHRLKVNGIEYTPDVNGFYQLGTFSSASSTPIEIKAVYRSCGNDSIRLYMGYNCFTGYPANLSGPNIALARDSDYFYIIPQAAQISATILAPALTPLNPATPDDGFLYAKDSVGMCTQFPVEIQINNSQPSVLSNVQAVITIPTSAGQPGLTFVSGSGYIEYPEDSVPRPFSVAANTALTTPPGKITLAFDLAQIDPSHFGFSGLPGTTDLTKNKVRLRFKFETNCNLQSGAKFKSLNKAKAPCGAGAIGNNTQVLSDPLNISSVTRSYTTDVDLNITGAEFTSCLTTLPGQLSIIKSGTKPVKITDSVYITFPAALDIDGTITCAGQPCDAPVVTYNNMVIGSQRIISWPMPQVFNTFPNNGNGKQALYNFNLRLITIDGSTPSVADVVAQVSERVTLFCGIPPNALPCPNSAVLLGEDQVNALLVNFPVIGLSKDVEGVTKQSNGSYDVLYSIILKNYGSVDLGRVKLLDTLINTFPAPVTYSVTSVQATGFLEVNTSYNGSTNLHLLDSNLSTLAVGESDTVTVLVNIIPSLNMGPFYNSAYAYARDSADCMYGDVSTKGDDPDPDGNGNPSDTLEDIPTPLSLRPAVIGASKTDSIAVLADGTYDVTFSIIVENFGTEMLTNVELTEDLSSVIPPPSSFTVLPTPVATGSLTVHPSFNGSTNKFLLDSAQSVLAVSDADTVTFTVKIAPKGYYGPFYNTAIARAIGALGGDVTRDSSDDGSDPDPDEDLNPNEDGENDPTPIILLKPVIGVAKQDTVAPNPDGTYDVTLNIVVENHGTDTLIRIQVVENIDSAIVPPSTYTLISAPVATGSLTTNSAFNGSGNTLLLDSASSTLATNASDTISFTIRVTPNGYYGPFYNSVIARGIGVSTDQATSDTSDEGYDPDTDGDLNPNEEGENDSTLILLTDFLAVDNTYVICQDSVLVADVSLNDLFPDVAISRLGTSPSNGITLLKTTGTFTFTPLPGFSGTDRFFYILCDNSDPQRCDTAVVTIIVNPFNRKPVAAPDKEHLAINSKVSIIDIQINDSASDTGQTLITTATIISGPKHGTARVINADSIQYQPEPNFCGKDTLFYEICDNGDQLPCGIVMCDTGMVAINITPTLQDSTCELPPNIPKGFSPNGDGQNDVLFVLGGPFHEMKLKIFNNWGEVIFESNIQSLGWDGKRNNIPQAQGVYIATLFVVMEDTRREFNITQDVTLFR